MFINPWIEKRKILITCPKGIVPWLAEEVRALGFPVLMEREAAVETEGTLADTMRLNLHIRTGHRVLYLIEAFNAEDPEGLYRGIRKIPWEELLYESGAHAYLCVTSTADTPTIPDPTATGRWFTSTGRGARSSSTSTPPANPSPGAATGRFPSRPRCRKPSRRP